jgi:hypothetical protein
LAREGVDGLPVFQRKYMAQVKQQRAAGAAYRDHIKTKDAAPELVDITVPSGFVFKFEKPSKFSMLFAAGQLPLYATNKAAESWKDDGLIDEDSPSSDQTQMIKAAFMIRDKVLRLSHTPKLVVGPASNDGELATEDVSDEDLDYLFKWVAAGGDVSAMLGNFPGRPQPSPLASASRKGKRYPVQQIGGNQ